MPESDVTKMKVADLKRELKLRGLAITGNKTELQDRLQTALLDGDISLEDSAITNEDALLDEDAVLTDEEESPIAADENELLKSPTSTPTASELASPLNEKKPSIETANTPINPKKIILKRKTSDGDNTTTGPEGTAVSTTSKENTEPSKEKVLKMSERNPITVTDLNSTEPPNTKTNNGTNAKEAAHGKKVVELSQMERLELRAKKFGLGTNSSAAPDKVVTKLTGNTQVSSGTGGPVVNDAKQIEMLKKRAERFGCVVSSKMAQIDAAEKLQKRKERFGAGSAATTGAVAGSAKTNDVWAEKARARLERFKNTTTSAGGKKVALEATSESMEGADGKKEPAPIVTPQTTAVGN
ncbi:SAP domain-containing ribonucleoprotein [Anastrepha ludens]|uniref:SAP domain-containing ribonucleoprotein n=1 Tax=Anastrepha ludens TaxID=28586 RepID=UPI0023AE9D89|nr:SAP domain-containing ribonucleoprotein [Anastrepha ludens]